MNRLSWWIGLGICVAFFSPALFGGNGDDSKPNIVFILVDDMGWTGTSVPAHNKIKDSRSDYYQTPSLEKLATQGMTFSSAYASSPMCTPSRASFLTGKSPAQLHMTTPGPVQRAQSYMKVIPPVHLNSLPENEVTIAEVLKKRGYATAHFGKWHLSGGGPGQHGFDEHDGETGNEGPGLYEDPNPKDLFGITKRAESFMEKSLNSGKPFYLHLSHYAVHGPNKCNAKTRDWFESRPRGKRHTSSEYAAMTKDFDVSVGRILAKLQSLGIEENTYVVFMSDNGAGRRNSRQENDPLAGGKGSLSEGGIRVPLIVRGPGVKSGVYCHESVIGFDLFPTICEWVGAKTSVHKGVEGASWAPLLGGKKNFKRKQKALVFHFPHYGKGSSQVPQSALLVGSKKLIKDYDSGKLSLYDLDKDIGESHDLAQERPSETRKLEKLLVAYLKKIKAQLPRKNQDFDSSATKTDRRKGSNRFISRMDKNGDGKVSKEEFTGPRNRFSRLDKNGDGVISGDEAPTGSSAGGKR
ncbi:MAG: sulfatase-like hydrolase/transferase [Planctomycetota bacterium]|nr:sulfatase-like hydrolase/transferase [Planctomycetota bacterium]